MGRRPVGSPAAAPSSPPTIPLPRRDEQDPTTWWPAVVDACAVGPPRRHRPPGPARRRSVSPAPARRSSPSPTTGRRRARPSSGPTAGPGSRRPTWPSGWAGAEAARQRTGLPARRRRGRGQAGLAGHPRAGAAGPRPMAADAPRRGRPPPHRRGGHRRHDGVGHRLLRRRGALIDELVGGARPAASRPPSRRRRWSARLDRRRRPASSACRRASRSSSAPAIEPAKPLGAGATADHPDGVVGHDRQRVAPGRRSRPDPGARRAGHHPRRRRGTAGWSRPAWPRRDRCSPGWATAPDCDVDTLVRAAAVAPPGAHGVVVLPWLGGRPGALVARRRRRRAGRRHRRPRSRRPRSCRRRGRGPGSGPVPRRDAPPGRSGRRSTRSPPPGAAQPSRCGSRS